MAHIYRIIVSLLCTLFLLFETHAQSALPETLSWKFDINHIAIDANRLSAQLESKGYNAAFFADPAIEVWITGFADCPSIEPKNEFLAQGRCDYLANFLESGRFGEFVVAKRNIQLETRCGDGEDHPEMRKVELVIRRKVYAENVNVVPDPPKPASALDQISQLEIGQTLVLDGLNFYPGSHRTLPEAKPVLKKLVDLMNANPTLKIEIQGHVCCGKKATEDGEDEETGKFNLSWTRAEFVYDHLIKSGIDSARVTYKGFAMTKMLVSPELTIQDQIKNRRVEVMVTGK